MNYETVPRDLNGISLLTKTWHADLNKDINPSQHCIYWHGTFRQIGHAARRRRSTIKSVQ